MMSFAAVVLAMLIVPVFVPVAVDEVPIVSTLGEVIDQA
jgi:hypothetical protein